MAADAALVDISDPRIYVDGPPHETFRWLRENDPVSRQHAPNGTPYWAVTRYADIREVNRAAERFRSGSGITFIDLVDHDRGNDNSAMMINMDAPRHTELRGIVQRGFTPKAIADLEGGTRRRARLIVDAICERGECDLMADIATLLPLQVIALLLGIPEEDFPLVLSWARGLGAPGTYESVSKEATAQRGSLGQVGMEMAAYAKDLAERRKADPRDDIVTKLVNASAEGEPMSEIEFQMFFAMLFIAGFDTTRHSLGNGFEALMANREQWDRLVASGTVAPGVVEEILRWATPIMFMLRTANEDTVVGGQPIAKNERVVMWYVSGNRDERAWKDPDRFDIDRNPNDVLAPSGHQSFGAGGPHYCLGNALARQELKVMLEELLRRMPDVEQSGPLVHAPTNLFNFVQSVPIRFSPSAPLGWG
jgi:cytochrome P450